MYVSVLYISTTISSEVQAANAEISSIFSPPAHQNSHQDSYILLGLHPAWSSVLIVADVQGCVCPTERHVTCRKESFSKSLPRGCEEEQGQWGLQLSKGIKQRYTQNQGQSAACSSPTFSGKARAWA